MNNDHSTERLDYQSGQRNEKEQRGEYTPRPKHQIVLAWARGEPAGGKAGAAAADAGAVSPLAGVWRVRADAVRAAVWRRAKQKLK